MSTKAYYPRTEIGPGKVGFSKTRSIIEAPFYGNNVIKVNTLREAYELAKNSPGTVVTDMPVYRGEEFGLEPDAKVLLFNDGSITGRYAPARRITGKEGVNTTALDKILMDAVYDTRWKTMYHAQVYIGLDPEFMVKAHLLIPEGEENLLYNWMLNFQYMSDQYVKMYKNSKPVGDGKEPDVYIFSDPQWTGAPGQEAVCDPKCLCYFNTDTNCAAILGMRYFGEHKKGTLTLAWAIANRNGYASCHGGQKEYTLDDGSKYVAAVFGLSGSGKSTLTHAKHDGKYPSIKVLHDDAFIINTDTCASIALEPTYFDKTSDYPVDAPDNKYLLTVQNCSATLDEDGKVVCVTEDIRNGNGRAIKSKLWSPNRVDKIDSPVNAIFWIMKDPTIPPSSSSRALPWPPSWALPWLPSAPPPSGSRRAWTPTPWWWSPTPTPSAPIPWPTTMRSSRSWWRRRTWPATSSTPATSWARRSRRRTLWGSWRPWWKARPSSNPGAPSRISRSWSGRASCRTSATRTMWPS